MFGRLLVFGTKETISYEVVWSYLFYTQKDIEFTRNNFSAPVKIYRGKKFVYILLFSDLTCETILSMLLLLLLSVLGN